MSSADKSGRRKGKTAGDSGGRQRQTQHGRNRARLHETDKSVRETQRVGDLKDTAQEESSSLNPAALAAVATSGRRSSRVHRLQFALQ